MTVLERAEYLRGNFTAYVLWVKHVDAEVRARYASDIHESIKNSTDEGRTNWSKHRPRAKYESDGRRPFYSESWNEPDSQSYREFKVKMPFGPDAYADFLAFRDEQLRTERINRRKPAITIRHTEYGTEQQYEDERGNKFFAITHFKREARFYSDKDNRFLQIFNVTDAVLC